MKQGIGFSVTLDIIVVFIVVTFAFLVASLNYYKAYKVNNTISDSIEKYEGYNDLAIREIETKLEDLGYAKTGKGCSINTNYGKLKTAGTNNNYCIYESKINENTNKFKYVIITYLSMDIPILNTTANIPVKTTTEPIYYFSD